MKAELWNKLTREQQIEHLKQGKWEMRSQMYIRSDAKFGEEKEGDSGTAYAFFKNGIQVGGWTAPMSVAAETAERQYEGFINSDTAIIKEPQ